MPQKNRTVEIDGKQVKFQLVRPPPALPPSSQGTSTYTWHVVDLRILISVYGLRVVGHCWAGAVPDNHQQLLPRLTGDHDCVRRDGSTVRARSLLTASRQSIAELSHLVHDMFAADRSFENVEYWLDEVDKYAGPNVQKVRSMHGNRRPYLYLRIVATKLFYSCLLFVPAWSPIVYAVCHAQLLVGNKSDLTGSRVITYEKGDKFARDRGMKFFETRCAAATANPHHPML